MNKIINLSITSTVDEITSEISNYTDYKFTGEINKKIEFELPPKDGFSIGLIVGSSGSGKTTVLKFLYGEEKKIKWNPKLSVASHFKDAKDAVDKLSGVGLNSIPTWMKPYHVLSNGEQYRANMARLIDNDFICDEFTSIVDRISAKSIAKCIHRYAKSNELKRIVLTSCHYDIIDWLQPDWILDMSAGRLIRGCLCQTPRTNFKILPCSREAWALFSEHHYLSSKLNKSSRCWIVIESETKNIIGFTSILSFPNGNFSNAWREHRTVILPEYQGRGIGVRVSDAIGEEIIQSGGRFFSKTAHYRMGEYREKSPLWKPTSKNKKKRLDYINQIGNNKMKEKNMYAIHFNRITYSHEYVGTNR